MFILRDYHRFQPTSSSAPRSLRGTLADHRSLQRRFSHNHHVQHSLGQETFGEFQGETCFCPVGISPYLGSHCDLLWYPMVMQLHGGEHLRKPARHIILRIRAKYTTAAIHGSRLGRRHSIGSRQWIVSATRSDGICAAETSNVVSPTSQRWVRSQRRTGGLASRPGP